MKPTYYSASTSLSASFRFLSFYLHVIIHHLDILFFILHSTQDKTHTRHPSLFHLLSFFPYLILHSTIHLHFFFALSHPDTHKIHSYLHINFLTYLLLSVIISLFNIVFFLLSQQRTHKPQPSPSPLLSFLHILFFSSFTASPPPSRPSLSSLSWATQKVGGTKPYAVTRLGGHIGAEWQLCLMACACV